MGPRFCFPARRACDRRARLDHRHLRGAGQGGQRPRRAEPINRGFLTAGILTSVIGTAAVALLYVGNDDGTESDARVSNVGWRVLAAVVIGLLAQVLSRLTEYFTSTETTPCATSPKPLARARDHRVLSGTASPPGLESSVY